MRLVDPQAMDETIATVLATDGPIVCHVFLDPKQGFEPRIKSRVMPDGTIVSPAWTTCFPSWILRISTRHAFAHRRRRGCRVVLRWDGHQSEVERRALRSGWNLDRH